MVQKEGVLIDDKKPFQFLGCTDTGPQSGARCPHCGADGRYIYNWAEFGKVMGAMGGCYQALTGKIKMDDIDNFIRVMSVKVAKGKPLNGWQKTVQRMQKYIEDNIQDNNKINWANGKISQAVAESKTYQFKKF